MDTANSQTGLNGYQRFGSICRRNLQPRLWTFSNPLRHDNKELCDVLIVCDPDVLLISVKSAGFRAMERRLAAVERRQEQDVMELEERLE